MSRDPRLMRRAVTIIESALVLASIIAVSVLGSSLHRRL